MNKELKPCPFCKSSHLARSVDGGIYPDYFDQPEFHGYVTTCTLHCVNCGAQMQGYATSDYETDLYSAAILDCYTKWNTRANEPQVIEKAESYKQEDEQEPLIINDDTREKLESDIYDYVSWFEHKDGVKIPQLVEAPYTLIMQWLNRQALITETENEERECTIVGAWDDYATKLEDERSELREKVDNLTAERDRLQERNDRQGETIDKLKVERDELSYAVDKLRRRVDGMFCLNDLNNKIIEELEAKRDKLINECDELRRVVKTQADSFAKMEQELAEARGGLHAQENTGVSR